MLDTLELWATGLAASPWVLLVLLVFVVVDAFFPPVPSETLLVALAALAVSTGGPSLWALVLVATVGAVVGDSIAYWLGRRLQIRRWRVLRARRVQSAFDWAERALVARPARMIIAARYIPVGRVAVTMTAGASRFSYRRFVGLSSLAGLTWAVYTTFIGVGAGVWLGDRPMLAVAVGVVGGVLLGYVVDWVLGTVLRLGDQLRGTPAVPVPERGQAASAAVEVLPALTPLDPAAPAAAALTEGNGTAR